MASGDRFKASRANEQSLLEVRQTLQRLGGRLRAVAVGGLQFIAEVQTAGPNAEADYSDRRHWVKEQKVSVDTGDPEDVVFTDKTDGRWVRAFNTVDQHFDDGTLVIVSVIFEDEQAFYFIERELAGEPGSGVTATKTVLVDFDPDDCSYTTESWEFVNGLLVSVT